MYQRILVPLDGSARAERILPYVEAIAHKFGARLVLAQIVEPGATAVFEAAWVKYVEEMQQLAHDAIRYLDKIQHQLQEKQIEATTTVEYGPVVGALLAIAEREQVDLIALASHGRTGVPRVFYGSVAAGLMNQTDRPLLIIRAQDEIEDI